jgi:hypothetical protein
VPGGKVVVTAAGAFVVVTTVVEGAPVVDVARVVDAVVGETADVVDTVVTPPDELRGADVVTGAVTRAGAVVVTEVVARAVVVEEPTVEGVVLTSLGAGTVVDDTRFAGFVAEKVANTTGAGFRSPWATASPAAATTEVAPADDTSEVEGATDSTLGKPTA